MAYGVRSQKFLCCLPVRLGVFILSFIQFVVSGAMAAFSFYAIFQKKVTLDRTANIVFIVLAALMTILAIISVFGFIGSIFRRQGLVRVYKGMLNLLLALNVTLGIVGIVLLFTESKSKLISTCINGSTDQDVINACNHVDTYRFVMIGFTVASWVVQAYECIIVKRYLIQLQEEKEEHWRLSSMKTYTQVAGRGSTEALNYPGTTYPYADKDHSYGAGPSYA
ncbi:hypothetical protein M0805_006016 [Coniferiporia weirii]|nr:hypothetical protein M0805_006016 [Coniferiporia weirii]